jgi:hypothetical protein
LNDADDFTRRTAAFNEGHPAGAAVCDGVEKGKDCPAVLNREHLEGVGADLHTLARDQVY